ncbi:MAG: 30S ribosomal protein S9 [Candidatus Gygaella obscura]|nr:30S ribosomal protein S9 [Candidatus Gygaella obscura]
MNKEQYCATGKRKESVARIRLLPGKGNIVVNKRKSNDYFKRETEILIVKQPLELTMTLDKFDIFANVSGGGTSGQAGAMRHGISRALVKFDESLKFALRKAGFLTRDPRAKERKKYGQKGARKRFQWTKR